jgi:hypothetical protein
MTGSRRRAAKEQPRHDPKVLILGAALMLAFYGNENYF